MDNKKILFVTCVLGLFLIAGCGQKTEVQPTGEIKEFDMIAKQWEFVPNTIEVNLGDKVGLHIENVDVAHGFALPDFGINEILEPNKEVYVEFIADKIGTFTFDCSVPCGKGHSGMKGQLVVK